MNKDIDIEKSVRRCILRIFGDEEYKHDIQHVEDETICIVDRKHIVMGMSKSVLGETYLRGFGVPIGIMKTDDEPWKDLMNSTGDSGYNSVYLKNVFDALEFSVRDEPYFKQRISIRMGTDSPIIIENIHMKFAIAPMLEDE